MNKARGIIQIVSDQGIVLEERATVTCMHCHMPRPDHMVTYWCSSCDARVCDDRVCRSRCKHFERKLEEQEARAAALRSYGV